MKITFIGASTCIPDIDSDVASFVIDGKHLVDTGWSAALRMRRWGFDPLDLESVVLTHLHQDHYIGLPQVLFYHGLRRRGDVGKTTAPLRIIGPYEHLQTVVDAAFRFLQVHRFPQLMFDHVVCPVRAGDSFDLGKLHFDTFAGRHVSAAKLPEEALVYRVTNRCTGGSFAFTGDTHYHEPIADFVRGTPLLIHDGAHTTPHDAATIARMAGVGQLVLIHYPQSRAEQMMADAKAVFPRTSLAVEGETLELS